MKTRAIRRPRPPVETADYLAMLRRLIRSAGVRVGSGDVEDFAVLANIHQELEIALAGSVDGLRASGHTWEAIGAATGVTRQAALMKWSHR